MQPITSLSQCDQEPIRTPGHIQPHGILFALDDGLNVTDVSENVVNYLDDGNLDRLFGVSILDLVSTEAVQNLEDHLRNPEIADYNPVRATLGSGDFNLIGHRCADRIIVELEKAEKTSPPITLSPYHVVRHAVAKMRQSAGLEELCAAVAVEIKRVTQFPRVIIYRFRDNWDGEVLVESRDSGVQSLDGLRFPASDIPAQARQLYTQSTQRIIPNVDYEPVKIVGRAPADLLDLSFSVLRSVSPFHLQYMRNMGVHASMSISIVREGKLWGLISCADEHSERHVSFEIRASCDFLSENMSLLIESKEAKDRSSSRQRTNSQMARLLRQMASSEHFVDGLLRQQLSIADLVSATGAAVVYNSQVTCTGATPTQEQILELATWILKSQDAPVWVTSGLEKEYPPAAAYRHLACGVVSGLISASRGELVLWFRPETKQIIHWGGNPHKEELIKNGQATPRTSFERWTETVNAQSVPWTDEELTVAADLCRGVIDVILQSSEELSALNSELERSNVELDAFAYAASHDLKEPLRGINNYTTLVRRALKPGCDFEDAQKKLDIVVRLTHRMEELISSLLRYSHLGRTQVEVAPIDLKDVVNNTLELLQLRIQNAHAHIEVEATLPVVLGDKTLIQEIFTNLLTNALKYNTSPDPTVTIQTSQKGDEVTVSVRDNGIGIAETHHRDVFKIFRRLHARNNYGGGTGIGLTITQRIIERHGGKLWLSSSLGKGSTFYFSLKGAHEKHRNDTRR